MRIYAKLDVEAVVVADAAESPRVPKHSESALSLPLCATPSRCCIKNGSRTEGQIRAAKSSESALPHSPTRRASFHVAAYFLTEDAAEWLIYKPAGPALRYDTFCVLKLAKYGIKEALCPARRSPAFSQCCNASFSYSAFVIPKHLPAVYHAYQVINPVPKLHAHS